MSERLAESNVEFPQVDWLDHKPDRGPMRRFLMRVGKAALIGFCVGWLSDIIFDSGLSSLHGPTISVQKDSRGSTWTVSGLERLYQVPLVAFFWGGVPGAIIGWAVGMIGTYRAAYGTLIGMAGGAIFTLLTHPFDGWLHMTVPLNSICGALIGWVLGAIPLSEFTSMMPSGTWGEAMSIIKGLLIIVTTGLGFAVCFAACGYALGRLVPDYYRGLFLLPREANSIDPAAIGLGLGVTQGMFVGLLIGCLLVLAVAWYRSRRQVVEKELGLARAEANGAATDFTER